jgi:serine/threonine protein kinase
VYLASHNEKKTEFAIKEIAKTKSNSDPLEFMRREIDILVMLDHPNIIKLVDCFEDKKSISLVLEL